MFVSAIRKLGLAATHPCGVRRTSGNVPDQGAGSAVVGPRQHDVRDPARSARQDRISQADTWQRICASGQRILSAAARPDLTARCGGDHHRPPSHGPRLARTERRSEPPQVLFSRTTSTSSGIRPDLARCTVADELSSSSDITSRERRISWTRWLWPIKQECERLDQLIREVALELIRVTGTGINGRVDCFLQRLVEEVDADRGTLIAASDRAETIEAAYGWARRPIADSDLATDAPRLKWFLEQLASTAATCWSSTRRRVWFGPTRSARPVRDRGSRLRPRPSARTR